MRSYRAKVVFIGNEEFINNGVVDIQDDGTIAHVGTSSLYADHSIDLDGAICPGFINTHCHLELSHLINKIPEDTSLPGFIQHIQKYRTAEESEIQNACKEADTEMQKNGIVAVADICNGNHSFPIKKESPIYYHNLIELFGLDDKEAKNFINRGRQLQQASSEQKIPASIIPHSPYSVSNELLNAIVKENPNGISSIHNQETESEDLLHLKQSGALAELLKSFGTDISYSFPNKQTAMKWFLPIIPKEQRLLLVHNTFVEEEDINYAKEIHSNLYWCFCPQANWYIERKLPNLHLFMRENLICTLGTDSLASNHNLSLLEEMKVLQHHFPWIKTEQLIKMACVNGANYLGLDHLGIIAKGRKAGLNHIQGLAENHQLNNNSKIEVLSPA